MVVAAVVVVLVVAIGIASKFSWIKMFHVLWHFMCALCWNSMHHFICHRFEWAGNEQAVKHNWGSKCIYSLLRLSHKFRSFFVSTQPKKLFRLIIDTIKLEYICIISHKGSQSLGFVRHSVHHNNRNFELAKWKPTFSFCEICIMYDLCEAHKV